MELLQGQTVQDACRHAGGRLSVAATLSIAHAVLETLSAAHAKNIVHRDIKPANLFMTHEGQLKVLDFGIARLRETGSIEANTLAGISLGTPAFMAPEQAMGTPSEVDAQSDVWSVGATMFRLLSGRKVHVGETSQHLIMLAAMTPAVPLASVMPEADPRLAAIVDSALAFAKKDRWPTAAAMRDEVGALYRSLFGASGPGTLLTDARSTLGATTELHLTPPPTMVSSADATGPSTPIGAAFHGVGNESAATTTAEPVSSGAVPAGRRGRLAPVMAAALLGAAVALVVAIGLWHRSAASPPSPSPASIPPATQTAGSDPTEPATPGASGSPMPPPTAQVETPAASASTTEGRSGASVAPSSTSQRPRRPSSPAPAPKPGTSAPPVTDFDRQ
jgi:serine/threonine-protein kinase